MTEMLFHQLKQGTLLSGKYRIEGILGEGGFGITYLAEDVMLEMKVAIKEYYPAGFVTREINNGNTVTAFTGDKGSVFEQGKEKFINEARTLGRLSGLPGIVNVRDYFQENNTAYIVMEFLEGITLKGYLKQAGGKISSGEMLSVLQPVVKALAEVHKQGLIHRDISPDNIMILLGDQVKLMDFGAARDININGEKSLSVMLKPGYAPEEQYRTRGEQGPWSDIYALCATAYRCITGVVPVESMERIRKDELKAPSSLGISIDPKKEKVLMKGLAVFKEDRIQNAEELYNLWYGGDKYKIAISKDNIQPDAEKNASVQSEEEKAALQRQKEEAKVALQRQKEEAKAALQRQKEEAKAEQQRQKEEAKAEQQRQKEEAKSERQRHNVEIIPQIEETKDESGKQKGSVNKIGIALAGCMALVAIIVFVVILNSSQNKFNVNDSSQNKFNVNASWEPVYASSSVGAMYDDSVAILASGNSLYYGEFDKKGEIPQIYWLASLSVDEDILSVGVDGNSLYVSVSNYGIWHANIGDTELEFQQIVPRQVEKFVVYDGYLYYAEDDVLYRISVTGTEEYVISENASDVFTVYGEYLFAYSNEENCIYRMKLDGNQKKAFENVEISGVVTDLLAVGGNLYFCDNVCYCINLETEVCTKLGNKIIEEGELLYWDKQICFNSYDNLYAVNVNTGFATSIYQNATNGNEGILYVSMLRDKLVIVTEENHKYYIYDVNSRKPYIPIFRYHTLNVSANKIMYD